MDTALKQRLIGAAVLVALLIIFLPMLVLRPGPEGGAAHVSLDAPDAPDRRFETREVPLLPAPAAPATPAPDLDDPNRVVTVDSDVAPRVDALPEDFVPPAATGPEVVPPAPIAAPQPRASDQATVTAPGPAPTPAPALPQPAPAAPAPAPAPARQAPLAADAGGNFAVNMGSYGDAANARALVQSLSAAGLPAYTEAVSSGGRQLQRVRLGPFAQRASAESARQRAAQVRSDINGTVVAIESAPGAAAPGAAPAAAAGAGFAVQVGAFRNEADANARRDRIRGIGAPAFVERVQSDSGPLWRVRAGPTTDRAAAERLRSQLADRLGLSDGIIVSHP